MSDIEDEDDDFLATPRKRRKSSHTIRSSSSSESSSSSLVDQGEIEEKVRRAAIILRFILAKSKVEEREKLERAKARLRFFYSPFTARPLHSSSSTALYQENSARTYAPGKRFLLMHRIRSNLLDNRWVELIGTTREFLKFTYNNAMAGTSTICTVLVKPLTLALCQSPITPQNRETLLKIFKLLSQLPKCNSGRLHLEFVHLLIATDQTDVILSTLRQPLRQFWKIRSIFKDPEVDAEVYALDTVATQKITPNTLSAGRTGMTLKSSDHWAAAHLAWHANFSENSQDLNVIWHAISGVNNQNEPSHRQIEAPASCRLRYALSVADTMIAKEPQIGTMNCNGNAMINSQFSDLLLYSPSDELLIFYSETKKLAIKDLLSLLFRMLDSPKLARNQKLWWRLRAVLVASRDDKDVIKEAHQQWVTNGRESWWPVFLEELGLPKGARKFARKALSTLQNL